MINSYELGWRMQQHAPEVLDMSRETPETLALYGIGEKETDNFGRQCLLARRLCESGVRYIQVTYGDNSANPAWDQHSNIEKHAIHAQAVDKPIAGLLADLKRRGLARRHAGVVGRRIRPHALCREQRHRPRSQSPRLHHVAGRRRREARFCLRRRPTNSATLAVENKVHMHDLHATILHLLGLHHDRLTFRYAGRNFRLTDVYGEVVHDLLA